MFTLSFSHGIDMLTTKIVALWLWTAISSAAWPSLRFRIRTQRPSATLLTYVFHMESLRRSDGVFSFGAISTTNTRAQVSTRSHIKFMCNANDLQIAILSAKNYVLSFSFSYERLMKSRRWSCRRQLRQWRSRARWYVKFFCVWYEILMNCRVRGGRGVLPRFQFFCLGEVTFPYRFHLELTRSSLFPIFIAFGMHMGSIWVIEKKKWSCT
jgi:hypothetical protein